MRVAELSDRELGDRAESAIVAAAVMPYSPHYQEEVDAVYAECARRGKGIYQRAWNRAVRDQGRPNLERPVVSSGP
jgi:hypothetical protein